MYARHERVRMSDEIFVLETNHYKILVLNLNTVQYAVDGLPSAI